MDLFWKTLVCIAGGVILFFTYRRLAKFYPGKPVGEAIVLIGCIAAAVFVERPLAWPVGFATLAVFAYRRVAKFCPGKPVGQTTILIVGIAAALLGEEGWLRCLPQQCDFLYNMTYALKWEFFSLLATAIITRIYWKTQLEGVHRIKQPYVRTVIGYGKNVWLALCIAALILPVTLWVSSRTVRFCLLGVHFVLVWAVAVCFLVADRATWKGFICEKDKNNDLKHVSMLTYFLADWPVVIALSLLGAFLLIHWPEHGYIPPWLIHYVHAAPKAVDPIDVWSSEEYFVAGAIAFQYLLSTSIYLILEWGVVAKALPGALLVPDVEV